VITVMGREKRLARVEGTHPASGAPVAGYEIHMGRTEGPDLARSWLVVEGRPEGAQSADGRVRGTYLHGLFAANAFREAWLSDLGASPSAMDYDESVDATLDALAAHVERHLDLNALLELAAEV
jgi:adenosylcobyric acid synthase